MCDKRLVTFVFVLSMAVVAFIGGVLGHHTQELDGLAWLCPRRDMADEIERINHKPLVALLGARQMIDLPPWILHFRMRQSWFD